MNLQTQLHQFHQEFLAKCPPEEFAILETAVQELRQSLKKGNLLQVGDSAPDFLLPSTQGPLVSLSDCLQSGKVILSFFRGSWCPYCMLELRAYQRVLPALESLGSSLLAVSPQTLKASQETAQRHGLFYDLLSDLGCQVAQDYGLAFVVPDAVKALYRRWGHPLPNYNGTDDWLLPIPATFIVDCDCLIVHAYIDAAYFHRYDPESALALLETLI